MKLKALLITRFSTRTIEVELLRRAIKRTTEAITRAQETLIALERKRTRQELELRRTAARKEAAC